MTIDQDSLEPGERVLWQGKPDVEAYCRRRELTVPPRWIGPSVLTVAVTSAALAYWTGDVTDGFTVTAATLLLVGALATYVRLRYLRDAGRVSYALTNRRAIIDRAGAVPPNRASVPYSDMPDVVVRDGPHGDVLFRVCGTQTEEGPRTWLDGFLAIENPRTVAGILRSAREAVRDRAGGAPV